MMCYIPGLQDRRQLNWIGRGGDVDVEFIHAMSKNDSSESFSYDLSEIVGVVPFPPLLQAGLLRDL